VIARYALGRYLTSPYYRGESLTIRGDVDA